MSWRIKKQVLFRACGVEKSGIVCQEPVPNIFEDSTCVLHINLPQQRTYMQKKFESETEEEEEEIVKKEVKDLEVEDVAAEPKVPTVETIEMFPVDDIGNNVTIVHDQQVSPTVGEEVIIEKDCDTSEPDDNGVIFDMAQS